MVKCVRAQPLKLNGNKKILQLFIKNMKNVTIKIKYLNNFLTLVKVGLGDIRLIGTQPVPNIYKLHSFECFFYLQKIINGI